MRPETPRASFPHTDKSLPKDRPFKTFRFQGNGFSVRRTAYRQDRSDVRGLFLTGSEEIDYAYRVVDAGYEIYYEPGCWVVEHNDPGGRKPRQEVEEMRLTNKLIISFKYLPGDLPAAQLRDVLGLCLLSQSRADKRLPFLRQFS